jgi:uncharacterized protein (TIGR02598 family)
VTSRQHQPVAFSLVEVVLALGVASFSLLAVLALFPVSVNTNQLTTQQTIDASFVRAIAADLLATPLTTQTSPRYQITIPTTGSTTFHTLFLQEDGTAGALDANADPAQNPKYRATIFFSAPANTTQQFATGVRILLTWPAMSDPTAAATPSKFSGSYEAYVALTRK